MQKKQRKHYSYYCYNCPNCGEYYHNGYTYTFGEDYRSVKRYKEYVDCGFDIIQARGGGVKGNAYKGGEFNGSNCERVFKNFLKAGGKKVLVTDEIFDEFINGDKDLIGEGKRFQSEAELDAFVKERVQAYCHQKGFYGIQLLDEPQYVDFPAYGQLVHSLQRVLPEADLQCNLFPIGARTDLITPRKGDVVVDKVAQESQEVPLEQHIQAYAKYVEDFAELTGLDYLLFDEYAFRREYIIDGCALTNYQIVGRVCEKRNLEFRTVLQSFSHVTDGIVRNRRIHESDMYWQVNLAMGFGARELSFYTYLAKPDFDYKQGLGEADGAAFINLDGSKTALYFYTQRILKELKKFEKIGLKYSYQSSHVVTEKGKTCKDFEWTAHLYEDTPCPINVDVDKGVVVVTQQKAVNGNGDKLYMIENIGNVRDELFDHIPPMQVRVELPAGKKKFYFRGKKMRVKADKDGKYTLSLKVGDAVFVEVK